MNTSDNVAVAPCALSQEQRAKLQSELDVVQSNMSVLGEMLSEITPGEEQPDELELLQVNLFSEKFQHYHTLYLYRISLK